MNTGIKQGALSSVILFKELKEKCESEPIIYDLHCLLHADDTLVLHIDLFIRKCNTS